MIILKNIVSFVNPQNVKNLTKHINQGNVIDELPEPLAKNKLHTD